jgi:hypothetical protein
MEKRLIVRKEKQELRKMDSKVIRSGSLESALVEETRALSR